MSTLAIVREDGAPAERRRRKSRKVQKRERSVTPAVATAPGKHHGLVPTVMFCAALLVGAVSGSFSIVGLTAVFTGAFWPIVAMGIALETAKLSGVAWLGRGYAAPRSVKYGMVVLIGALVALNAIGSYGFLAKAQLDHAIAGEAQVRDQSARIDARRELASASLSDLDRRIAQIDAAVDEATRRGRTTSAVALATRAADRRNELVGDRARAAGTLASIEVEQAGVENERNGLAAASGPVRYLSRLIGIDQDTTMRWFVLFVALLLDPLALVLLLAATAPAATAAHPQPPVSP
jgi:hypothetical protein